MLFKSLFCNHLEIYWNDRRKKWIRKYQEGGRLDGWISSVWRVNEAKKVIAFFVETWDGFFGGNLLIFVWEKCKKLLKIEKKLDFFGISRIRWYCKGFPDNMGDFKKIMKDSHENF